MAFPDNNERGYPRSGGGLMPQRSGCWSGGTGEYGLVGEPHHGGNGERGYGAWMWDEGEAVIFLSFLRSIDASVFLQVNVQWWDFKTFNLPAVSGGRRDVT